MDYYRLNAFITTFLFFILALIPIIKDRNNKLYLWLSFLNFCGALWQFDLFMLKSVNTVEQANLVSRILRPFMLLIPFVFLNFSALLIKKKINKKIIVPLFISTLISILLNVSGVGFGGCKYDNLNGFIPTLDVIYVIFIINMIFGVGAGFTILIKKFSDKDITTNEKKQIQYYVLGTFIASIGGVINLLNITGFKIYPIGTFGLFIYLVLITYSILSYNLLNIKDLLQKFIIYLFCSAVVVCIYYLANKFILEPIPDVYYKTFLLLAITFLVVVSIEPTFRFFEKITKYFLFVSYYDYQTLLQFVLIKLRIIREQDEILLELLKLSSDILKIKYNSIFYFDTEKNKYRLYDLEGKKDEFIERENSLIKYAMKKKDVFYFKKISDDYNYDISLKNEYKDVDLKEIYELLKKLRAEICIPIIINNEFTGIWIVGEKFNKKMMQQEEVKWLINLEFQAGLIIENIVLFEQLLQSHKFAMLGKMSAAVAHEIRNPITGLYGFLQMIENQRDEKSVNKFFDIANDEFKRIERLTTNLLSLGHATKLKKENTDINELLKQVCEILSVNLKKSNVNLIEKYEKLPIIKLDREMIKQVLINLMFNSIQAMHKGGDMEIGTKMENNNILIYIKDTGTGIDDEIKNRIFEPFYTTKSDGSGIGLTLAKSIIEAHNGNINFESEKNKGSVFFISLPMEP
ncbi:MAG: hypothetical protein KA120_04475 [Candidatus Goldbacteria bacterium]|nr:hypothetical protein [Candidatus Goldiibacteriota bacterium]